MNLHKQTSVTIQIQPYETIIAIIIGNQQDIKRRARLDNDGKLLILLRLGKRKLHDDTRFVLFRNLFNSSVSLFLTSRPSEEYISFSKTL